MERIAEITKSLAGRLERLVAAAQKEGRDEALAEIRALIAGGDGEIPAPKTRGPGRPKGSKNKATSDAPAKAPAAKSSGKRRKNPWAGLSPADRLARVNAIRKGRGLPPKEEE